MFKALIVDGESGDARTSCVHEALADAGCVDIASQSFDDAMASLEARAWIPDLVVIAVDEAQLPRLHRLTRTYRELPVVAICDEVHIEAVRLAGASELVTTPIRSRELVARIRCAMRDRKEATRRERRMTQQLDDLRREKEDLERFVCVDVLTGISNRRHALSLLAAEWRRSGRDHSPLGLVMIDLDCYHAYNEQYGHLGGDRCLQLVCEAMSSCLRRPADYLGRYGGEEFMAVLPNTDAVGAKIVAERLRAAVEALAIPHAASQCAKVVTITAGFASLRVTPDLTMDKLISVADAALLRAKAQGRNRVEGDAPLTRPSRVSAQRWQRFQPVVADPWFANRIPSFLAEAHVGARSMLEALRVDESGTIERVATSLRNGSRELGLDLVERLIGDFERAVHTNDVNAAREAADELFEYVTHVQVIYRRPSETPLPRAATNS